MNADGSAVQYKTLQLSMSGPYVPPDDLNLVPSTLCVFILDIDLL